MTPQQIADDVVTGDTVPITLPGKHVSPVPSVLSIHSFVGGRFPRHRVADREFAEFPELAS